jgi:site-specific recombinase XerC
MAVQDVHHRRIPALREIKQDHKHKTRTRQRSGPRFQALLDSDRETHLLRRQIQINIDDWGVKVSGGHS